MCKLSVIVPVYNDEKYLDRCVQSILNQNFADFELILVDDGSSDRSGSMCDGYAERDKRVRVCHKQNGGISNARNTGISLAVGDYIAFVDHDDEVDREIYTSLLERANEGNYDIVVCDFIIRYPDVERIHKTYEVYPDHCDTYRSMLLNGYGGLVWNMVIKRKTIIDNGILFPEHLKHCEDVWFSWRLHLCTDSITKVEKPLYYYNLSNPSQVSANLNDEFDRSAMTAIDSIIDYMEKKGVLDLYKRELNWIILRYKSHWVFDPSLYDRLRDWRPESFDYLSNCPILSNRMKFSIRLIQHHLDPLASSLSFIYKKANK